MDHEHNTALNTAPESTEKPADENMAEGNEYSLVENPAAENAALVENAAGDMGTGKENGDPSRENDTPGSVTGEPSPLSGKEKAKDILLRAAKTFAQTALGCLIAGLAGADLFSAGGAFWKGLLLSSLSAGLSAAWNTALALLK